MYVLYVLFTYAVLYVFRYVLFGISLVYTCTNYRYRMNEATGVVLEHVVQYNQFSLAQTQNDDLPLDLHQPDA